MKKKIVININELESEYTPNEDIFCEDSEIFQKLKKIIFKKLTVTERRIILCYAEYGNLRDTAKIFNVSASTIWIYINRIKKKIYSFL